MRSSQSVLLCSLLLIILSLDAASGAVTESYCVAYSTLPDAAGSVCESFVADYAEGIAFPIPGEDTREVQQANFMSNIANFDSASAFLKPSLDKAPGCAEAIKGFLCYELFPPCALDGSEFAGTRVPTCQGTCLRFYDICENFLKEESLPVLLGAVEGGEKLLSVVNCSVVDPENIYDGRVQFPSVEWSNIRGTGIDVECKEYEEYNPAAFSSDECEAAKTAFDSCLASTSDADGGCQCYHDHLTPCEAELAYYEEKYSEPNPQYQAIASMHNSTATVCDNYVPNESQSSASATNTIANTFALVALFVALAF